MRLVDTVILRVDSLSADWVAEEGEVFYFSSLCHVLSLSPLCLGEDEEKGQRRLTSAGHGKSDRKQEVERQTIEWRPA